MTGGLLLLALAWSLRPRPGTLPQDGPVLHRADAPELFARPSTRPRSPA